MGTCRFFLLFVRLKVNDRVGDNGFSSVFCLSLFVAFGSSDVFERPTLRGCQRWDALGRVKSLRILTLPCQETNPDGVICGRTVAEMGWLG